MTPLRALLAALLAGALVAVALAAPGAQAAVVKPDLVADPVGRPGEQIFHDGTATRRLVRFDGFVHNRGPGPLEITGHMRSAWRMTSVFQRLYDNAGGAPVDAVLGGAHMLYETADGHDHWHLERVARYSLVTPGGTEVAPAAKVGFCLLDVARMEAPPESQPAYLEGETRFCGQYESELAALTEGVSAGWTDVYGRHLWFQWVDVSNTPPGAYRLRMEVDPEGFVLEANEDNPPADVAYNLPGYVAEPGSATVAEGGTVEIDLRHRAFLPSASLDGTALDAPQYRIEEAPEHGDIDVPVGQWRSGTTVRYTPRDDGSAVDELRFSVRENGAAFPRTPPVASVAIDIDRPTPTVAIGGAPERVVAGMSVQLTAALSDTGGPVTWSVDGIEGGDDAVGRITADGLYTAPAVPPAGRVTIRASVPEGATDAVEVEIVPATPPKPAPVPPEPEPEHEHGPGTGHAGDTSTGGGPGLVGDLDGLFPRPPSAVVLRATRRGRLIATSAYPRRSGRLRLSAVSRGRILASCRLRVRARRSYACALRLRRKQARRAKRVFVFATIRGRDGRVDQLRVRARRARSARSAGHVHRHP